jgi:hypothetical protein
LSLEGFFLYSLSALRKICSSLWRSSGIGLVAYKSIIGHHRDTWSIPVPVLQVSSQCS